MIVVIVAIVGLLGVIITAFVGLLGAWIGYQYNEDQHRRATGVKMIEIALGILAGEPENKHLRDWAVDVLANYSKEAGVPLDEQAKDALRDKPLPVTFTSTIFDAATGRSYGRMPRGLGATGESGELFEVPMPPRESTRERDGGLA